jgi:hypothetical protein
MHTHKPTHAYTRMHIPSCVITRMHTHTHTRTPALEHTRARTHRHLIDCKVLPQLFSTITEAHTVSEEIQVR